MRNNLLLFLLVLLSLNCFSQKLEVRGGFVQDHFELGDEVQYYLTATYPDHMNLFFPDSTYNFSPFEYSAKNYYPSKRLPSGQVYDTAIYTLQCYEIDPSQGLSVPVIILSPKGDSTKIFTKADTILFYELAPVVTDTTSLRTNVAYTEVDTLFNFPLLWISLGVVVVLALVTFLIFGKKIRRILKLKKLKKDYIRFSEELTQYIRTLKENPDKITAERALVSWKNFSERLEDKPYSRMTTREILGFGYTAELDEPLRGIDKCIYGGATDKELYRHFQSIEDFTQHRYTITVDEIKNSK
ncbi:hypothetical protein [Marinoscillum sp. MHG1-6]|uniref:hypothetical protein n=1 Tax=Marinoscillum sp. MHG1-6 TaxID=2959627 RepID=UPI002157FCBA|nr:hypothetical protein [Marinoscillum sp. MHG1-6]